VEYRKLGKTGLEISEISIGTEYLEKIKREDLGEVIQKAIANGINFIDILYNFDNFLEQISKAIKGSRDKIILNHHLGSSELDGKYNKDRSMKKIKAHFEKYLEIMNTDYVDIAFIHFVHTEDEFDECWKEGGVKDFALQLKKEGKARFVGLSIHRMDLAIKVAESGDVDVIMIQINLANHAHPQRQEMLATCEKHGIGVIAMKPFAGGKLLQPNKSVSFPDYLTAFHEMPEKKISEGVKATQCLHYILNQIGISTIVPGVANIDELEDCLSYYSVSDEKLDYTNLLKDFEEYVTGECVYCNHCQPCPEDIDIASIFRLHDQAQIEQTDKIQEAYIKMDAKASDCIECGDCEERCPFDVQVIEKMKEAATFFE